MCVCVFSGVLALGVFGERVMYILWLVIKMLLLVILILQLIF